MKEEWRSVTMDAGEQSVLANLMVHSQVSSAGNWLEIMHVRIPMLMVQYITVNTQLG